MPSWLTVRQRPWTSESMPLSTDMFCNFQGLGGTSLLNANVFMRADEKTIACRLWPKEIRHEGLDKCKMLVW